MIRLAEKNDMNVIMAIYSAAREYMKKQGNGQQWGDGFPYKELLESDIEKSQLYVFEENGSVHGVFAFIIGKDPTYKDIENGSWRDDVNPYGTLHRVAGDGVVKGVFEKIMIYVKDRNINLRIDTHEKNQTMRHLIIKNGFQERGIIYLEDGDPRLAYEYIAH